VLANQMKILANQARIAARLGGAGR
jgi:hypothetical protein